MTRPEFEASPRIESITRRRFLATGAVATASLAGCLGAGDGGPTTPETADTDDVPQRPRVENPPSAVYTPTHRAGMSHLKVVTAGDYALSPMVSYPHEFWLVAGSKTKQVLPSDPGVHLMFTVWDAETQQVIPIDSGPTMRVSKDDELVDQRAPWPMISQTMGLHFGDNVPLPESGPYTVEVDFTPMKIAKTGEFADRFINPVTVTFEFDYTDEIRRRFIEGTEYLDEERWGEPGALEPMMMHGDSEMDSGMDGGENDGGGSDMGMAFSQVPRPDAYPGRDLGQHTSGDATFVVRYLEDSRFASGGGYLLVSPRTPYNRIPLPDMALSVEPPGADATVLTQTLNGEIGFHYGASLDLSPGDELEIVVESPPQVARHAGYETAFLDMEPIQVAVTE